MIGIDTCKEKGAAATDPFSVAAKPRLNLKWHDPAQNTSGEAANEHAL